VTKVARLLREEGLGRLAMVSLRFAISPLLGFGRVVFFLRELDGQETQDRRPLCFSRGRGEWAAPAFQESSLRENRHADWSGVTIMVGLLRVASPASASSTRRASTCSP